MNSQITINHERAQSLSFEQLIDELNLAMIAEARRYIALDTSRWDLVRFARMSRLHAPRPLVSRQRAQASARAWGHVA